MCGTVLSSADTRSAMLGSRTLCLLRLWKGLAALALLISFLKCFSPIEKVNLSSCRLRLLTLSYILCETVLLQLFGGARRHPTIADQQDACQRGAGPCPAKDFFSILLKGCLPLFADLAYSLRKKTVPCTTIVE